jgi:hypothetical protein
LTVTPSRGDRRRSSTTIPATSVDRLWIRGSRAKPETAAAIWRQLNARLVTQAYSVPTCTLVDLAFVSKKVGGIGPSVISYGFNALTDWYPTGK